MRAAGIAELEIIVDSRERYGYRFIGQQARTVKQALPCGDYAVTVHDQVVAAVERKSLPDLVSSLINGTLRYALGELSALPRAALVVEERYSQVFKLDRIRPAVVADALAELQVRWPDVPIVFCETGSWPKRVDLPVSRRGQHRNRRARPHHSGRRRIQSGAIRPAGPECT